MSQNEHISVLLNETINALDIKAKGKYLDATFGRGGHSKAILEKLDADGVLYALDRDPEAKLAANKIQNSNFHFYHKKFSAMLEIFPENTQEILDGILFDLGVSSPQLDQAKRGFSFTKEAPLDMRMDNSTGITAKEWLMQVELKELIHTIHYYGDEPYSLAKRIAQRIFSRREHINTTVELAELVSEAMPKSRYKPNHHPATQTFQAIRIVVNDEYTEIQNALRSSVKLLKKGGVLAIISFHGGEDLIVKRFIREQEGKEIPSNIPIMGENNRIGQVLKLINPVIKPSKEEIESNIRARSAKLRLAVKI